MAIGLATGMGYLAVAALFAGLMCLVNLLLSVSGFGKSAKGERILRMTIPRSWIMKELLTIFLILTQYVGNWRMCGLPIWEACISCATESF